MPHQLRPGLSFCVVEHTAVFLDITANRYFALPPAASAPFLDFSGGASLAASDAANLVASGVLVKAAADVPPRPCSEQAATNVVDPSAVTPTFVDIMSAAFAVAEANLRLNHLGLASTLGTIQRNKTRLTQDLLDRADPAERVIAAHRKHGILFGALDRCLPLSIGLVAALARHGIAADLLLGVMLSPFRAHAWVERSGLLLNDRPDRVRNFKPILRL